VKVLQKVSGGGGYFFDSHCIVHALSYLNQAKWAIKQNRQKDSRQQTNWYGFKLHVV